MKNKIIKTMAVLLAAVIILTVLPLSMLTATAASFDDINDSSVFVKQQTNYTCTLAAATMLVRRAAMMNGNSNWRSITESTMRGTAWNEGSGLWWSFTYAGITVNHANFSGNIRDGIISFLANHPEGLVVYNRNQPHAVLITDYTNGKFYCSDSGISTIGRIPLSSSMLSGSGESNKINNLTDYWYVSTPKVSLTSHTTHSYTTYVYYWNSHPHYKCYKCSCGEVKENRNEPTFVRTCEQCLDTVRPSKPVFTGINESYYDDESVTFNWNDCKNATHYNFWLYQKKDDGTWKTYEHTYYVEKGFLRKLPVGEYRAVIQAYNSNYYEADHSDWLYCESDYVYFDVVEQGITGECGDSLTWKFKDDTLTISGTGDMWDYGFGVNRPWFAYNNEIKTLIIENSVSSIGVGAFYDCSGLTSVTIGNGATSIGEYAFQDCSGLTSITIPNSVTSIGDGAFAGCTGLTGINIPNSVKSIGSQTVSSCTGLTSITIPDSVTSIDSSAFWGCTGLTSITIPNSVTSIGDGAFAYCTGLTSITIPNSVTSIGSSAFLYCTGLESITVDPNNQVYHSAGNCLIKTQSKTLIKGCKNSVISTDGSVTSIGDSAFSGCTGLTSITIPNSVTSIGDGAFAGCTGLTSITIPDSVTSVDQEAFYGCTGLTSITIGNGVTSIGVGAFFNTGYYNDQSNWENDVLYINNCLIKAKDTVAGSYNIKNGTQLIAGNAFFGCTGLTSITIPDSVTSIGDDAFYGCTGLESITIPDSITSIGEFAFWGCTGLTDITIPNSVTSIGECAFSGCTGLESITVDPNNQIYRSAGNCLIKTQSKTLIQGCKNSVIPNDGSVTSIGEDAFWGCTGLTSITIPNSVTSIGDGAFSGCTGLTNIIIPNSVTSIDNYAFYNCTGLETVIYFGTETQWNNIEIENYNDCLLSANRQYNDEHVHIFDNDQDITCNTCGYVRSVPTEINENDPQAVIESKTVKPGDTVTLTVALKNTPAIKSMAASNISYDSSALILEDVKWIVTDAILSDWNPEKGNGVVTGSYAADRNGVVLTLTFKVKDNAAEGDYNIGVNYQINTGTQNVSIATVPGILTVKNYTPGDVDGNDEITDADAVYLLFYTFFPDDYPVNQPCDFNGDGFVTDEDAIYLLFYTFFPEDYPIV